MKTRVLRFALELRDDLGVSGDLSTLPSGKVDQIVITNIYGGNNIIASKDFTQIGTIEIATGDWHALAKALNKTLGVPQSAVSELRKSLDEDAKETPPPSLGKRPQNG